MPAATPNWTAAELATLAQLAETFVRGGAVRRAALTAEALTAAADPDQVRQLRLVLRLIQSPLANLLLAGTPRSFSDLSPAARERYLLGWADSRLALRRTAFHGLRKLLTFLAYADPGEGAPNPLLAAIGYRPDDAGPAGEPTPIRPYAPALRADPDRPVELEADVIVVGSGAGGGVIAHDLARTGRSVVVLEAGRFVDEASMPRDELAAFDRLYLDHGLVATWDGAVTILAGGAVGGGTLVNWMTCVDSPPDVRADWASDHGLAGWDAPSAERDVLDLERELSVGPTRVVAPKDLAILRGAATLGWDAEPTRRNTVSCDDCGSCPFGCGRGTKQSGIRAHLADAYRAGARIVPGAEVRRVLVDGGRATGVEGTLAVRSPDGSEVRRPLVVLADRVVVAAGALRTPAILERSGVGHPALGRHLRLHPVPVVAARFAEPIDMWRGPMQGARCAQFLRPEPGRSTYMIESAPGHPGLLALAFPWRGTDAHAGLVARARFWAPLIAVTRDGGEGRVAATRSGRVRIDYRLDALGVATLRHALVAMARLARAADAREIVAFGTQPRGFGDGGRPASGDRAFAVFLDALAAFDFRPNRGTVFSAHQMGTARMGAEPRAHACDPDGRVRSGSGAGSGRSGSGGAATIGGLYVGDASLFPTAIGVNPMITVMAPARRVGRTVLAESGDRSS